MDTERGQSAIVVPVAAAEPLVARFRARFDSSADSGMPAHVTLLYPFLSEDVLDEAVLGRLAGVVGAHRSFDVSFAATGRFPAVLYLAPDSSQPFRALTDAIHATWPQAPPYGGIFDDVVPHLTVANSTDQELLAKIERQLAVGLPVKDRVALAELFVFDGSRWTPRMSLPLGA